MAREMSRPLRLFIAAQPTRGVDVGSIEFIHSRIIHERDVGTAVLVVSSELDEVVGLADRIAVMYRGRILAIVSPDTPREEIGLLMAGITGGRARAGGDRRPVRRRRGRVTTDGPVDAPEKPRRSAPEAAAEGRAATSFLSHFLHNLWSANTVTVTVLSIVLAHGHRRGPDRRLGRRRAGHVLATSPPGPATRSTRSWTLVSTAYADLFKGAIVDPAAVSGLVRRHRHLAGGVLPDLRDADLRRAAGLHRPVGGAGVPRRPVQHRRPGPGGDRHASCAGAGRLPARRCRPCCTWSSRWSPALLGGALWGFVPGILKARTGAHEVITTIMLNYTATLFLSWLILQKGVQDPGRTDAISKPVDASAQLPVVRRRSCGCTSASCSPCWPPPGSPGCSTGRRSASSCARSAPTRPPPGPPA